jgi:prophage regulatory protein
LDVTEKRIHRLKDLKARTGLTPSTIYDLMGKGRFPKPIKLGGVKASGWLEDEIAAWERERVAERDGKPEDWRSSSPPKRTSTPPPAA